MLVSNLWCQSGSVVFGAAVPAGDLGNVTADVAGAVSTTFKDQYISLKPGRVKALGLEPNVAGRSIVVRKGADDFITAENDGGAGPIVAYGVLKPLS